MENNTTSLQKAVSEMTEAIVGILNGQVYGAWLYGSVVMKDFRPGWSDIDFVVLTDCEITEEQANRLLMLRQVLTERENGNPYYRSFEGIIANLTEYRTCSFRRMVYWGTGGQRITDSFSLDAFSRYELAVCGQSVYGERKWPFPKSEREELVQAVRGHYETIRKYAVRTDERLYSCGWLLDIARCIYTLRYGDVISKTEAGLWAIENQVFPDDAPLRKAVAIREQPGIYKDRPEIREWLAGLGPVVQEYANALENELRKVM